MLEIDIATIDPVQHEPKIFLGMTARQCICIVPSVALGAALFFVCHKFMSVDSAVIAAAVGVAPGVLFGWVKPYDMKFEQYLLLLYQNHISNPPARIYKTDSAEEMHYVPLKKREAKEKQIKEREFAAKKQDKDNAQQAPTIRAEDVSEELSYEENSVTENVMGDSPTAPLSRKEKKEAKKAQKQFKKQKKSAASSHKKTEKQNNPNGGMLS